MKWVFWIFTSLYVLAILLFLISVLGWFGQQKDPLGAVFLLPLGLPWSMLADKAGLYGLLFGPVINVIILLWLWRRKR